MGKCKVTRRSFDEYTSNLVKDEALALRFNQAAYKAVRGLKSKYFSLFCYMTEDDVVLALWEKILSQDISYDETKKNIDSFARMMVNNRCIDLSRMIRKHEGVVSLDSTYTSDDGDDVTLENFIEDRSSSEFAEDLALREMIRNFNGVNNISCDGVSLEDLFSELLDGKSVKEVASERGVSPTKLNKMLKRFKSVCINRIYDTGHTLEDILFDDSLDYFKNTDIGEFLDTLSYVSDVNSGIKLSEVVKLLIDEDKEYTYGEIADKLAVKKNSLISFLDKSLQMVF